MAILLFSRITNSQSRLIWGIHFCGKLRSAVFISSSLTTWSWGNLVYVLDLVITLGVFSKTKRTVWRIVSSSKSLGDSERWNVLAVLQWCRSIQWHPCSSWTTRCCGRTDLEASPGRPRTPLASSMLHPPVFANLFLGIRSWRCCYLPDSLLQAVTCVPGSCLGVQLGSFCSSRGAPRVLVLSRMWRANLFLLLCASPSRPGRCALR